MLDGMDMIKFKSPARSQLLLAANVLRDYGASTYCHWQVEDMSQWSG